MKLPPWLTKQVGPLPAGVWILAVGGGLAIAYYSSRNKPAPVEEAEPGSEDGLPRLALPTGTYVSGPVASSVAAQAPTIETNLEWRRRAVELLTLRGYSPSVVDTALANYLGGLPLTSEAQNMAVEAALRELGVPPEGTAPLIPFEVDAAPLPTPGALVGLPPIEAGWITQPSVVAPAPGYVLDNSSRQLDVPAAISSPVTPAPLPYYTRPGGSAAPAAARASTYTPRPFVTIGNRAPSVQAWHEPAAAYSPPRATLSPRRY